MKRVNNVILLIIILTTFLCSIANPVFSQYNRETTIEVLTNNGSRQWQLDTIKKTLGGCQNETLLIIFKKDQTAELKYCNNGSWQTTSNTWKIQAVGKGNNWDLVFLEEFKFNHKNEIINLKRCRIKLFGKDLKNKGSKMFLTTMKQIENSTEYTDRVFYSKD